MRLYLANIQHGVVNRIMLAKGRERKVGGKTQQMQAMCQTQLDRSEQNGKILYVAIISTFENCLKSTEKMIV